MKYGPFRDENHMGVLDVDDPCLVISVYRCCSFVLTWSVQVGEGNGDTYLRLRHGHWGWSDPWCRIDRLQARALETKFWRTFCGQILDISPAQSRNINNSEKRSGPAFYFQSVALDHFDL